MKRKITILLTVFILVLSTGMMSFAESSSTEIDDTKDGPGFAETLSKNVMQATAVKKISELLAGQISAYDSDIVQVPVLMYHHISVRDKNCTSPDKFRQDMISLKEEGYETINYDDLYDFVNGDKILPLKPVIITFDDGYTSNYEEAYPILKEFGMKAEISLIGASVGQQASFGNSVAIIPHFTWEHAAAMYRSGVFKFRSHSYGLHSHVTTGNVTRKGIMKNDDESEEDYDAMLSADCERMEELINRKLGYRNNVFTYPYGSNDPLTERILQENGYDITATVNPGINTVKRGDPSTLRMLKRVACDGYGGSAASLIRYYAWAYK